MNQLRLPLLTGVVGLLVGLTVGGTGWMASRRAAAQQEQRQLEIAAEKKGIEASLAECERREKVAGAQQLLGAVVVELHRENFGLARERLEEARGSLAALQQEHPSESLGLLAADLDTVDLSVARPVREQVSEVLGLASALHATRDTL